MRTRVVVGETPTKKATQTLTKTQDFSQGIPEKQQSLLTNDLWRQNPTLQAQP